MRQLVGFLFPISWTTVKGKSWALSITMGPCECRVPIELLLNGWIWMETTQYVHSVQRLGTFTNLSPHTQVNCYKNTGAPISIPSSIKFNCPNFPHISWRASNPQFNHSPFFASISHASHPPNAESQCPKATNLQKISAAGRQCRLNLRFQFQLPLLAEPSWSRFHVFHTKNDNHQTRNSQWLMVNDITIWLFNIAMENHHF